MLLPALLFVGYFSWSVHGLYPQNLRLGHHWLGWPPPPPSRVDVQGSKTYPATFSQWVDHKDKGLGTFQQHYCWSDAFYSGPGAPVVVIAPSEGGLGPCGRLYTNLIFNRIAKELGAGIVALEHRYYGKSSPYRNITTITAQHLTLSNAIADLINFAENAELPFDRQGKSKPHKAPWVLAGCSYSGALSAWTASVSPGIYFAYYAGSAVVEAIKDFWTYFVPIIEAMPQGCSLGISRVIDHIDAIGTSGTLEEQDALKSMFGLGGLSEYVDFASALAIPIYDWQYFPNLAFCRAVEEGNNGSGSSGVEHQVPSLEKALKGYSDFFKSAVLPGYCERFGFKGKLNIECLETFNSKSRIYTDTSIDNPINRQWMWMLCNEPFYWWTTGAPKHQQTIASRLVTTHYFDRQCELFFPRKGGFCVGSADGKSTSVVNDHTKGWSNTTVSRLNTVNSQFDPYREATVSSDFRPGGPLKPSPHQPVRISIDPNILKIDKIEKLLILEIVSGGFHCSDVFIENSPSPAQVDSIAQIKAWVKEFKPRE